MNKTIKLKLPIFFGIIFSSCNSYSLAQQPEECLFFKHTSNETTHKGYKPLNVSDKTKEQSNLENQVMTISNNNCAVDLPYKYVGNSFSQKFHRPSCPFAKEMSSQHLVLFHFRKEATEAGQIPCKYCLPPFWKTVKCQIINGANEHIDFPINQSDKSSIEQKESEQTKHLAQ